MIFDTFNAEQDKLATLETVFKGLLFSQFLFDSL